jgi:(p)ppGpp synthase/HD superfamily hydrolase
LLLFIKNDEILKSTHRWVYEMNLIQKAREFAKKQHGNKKRKCNEDKFYYMHPYAVARQLQKFGHYKDKKNIIAAAYLHDVIEETGIGYKELKTLFNVQVADLVKELTSDAAKYKDANENKGYLAKGKYLTNKLNNMSENARVIKLADREDNVSSLSECSPSFATRYAKETQYILNHIEFEPNRVEKQLIKSIWKSIRPFLT